MTTLPWKLHSGHLFVNDSLDRASRPKLHQASICFSFYKLFTANYEFLVRPTATTTVAPNVADITTDNDDSDIYYRHHHLHTSDTTMLCLTSRWHVPLALQLHGGGWLKVFLQGGRSVVVVVCRESGESGRC